MFQLMRQILQRSSAQIVQALCVRTAVKIVTEKHSEKEQTSIITCLLFFDAQK